MSRPSAYEVENRGHDFTQAEVRVWYWNKYAIEGIRLGFAELAGPRFKAEGFDKSGFSVSLSSATL